MMDPSLLVAVTGFIHYVEGDPKYLTVADAKRAAGIPRRIRSAVQHYVAGTKWPGLELEAVPYSWKKLSKAINELDPDDIDTMTRMIAGLPDSDDLIGGYVGALQKVLGYVTAKMPQNGDVQMTGIRERPPAPIDVYRWGRIVTLAEEPLYVLQWLHEGRLTTAAVDCLRETYPPILATMVSETVEALAVMQGNGAWNLTRAQKGQLSLLLGDFAAPGLQQAIQAMLGDEQAKQADRSPPVSSTSRVAKQFHSTTKEA
jgi:hypothetical protein